MGDYEIGGLEALGNGGLLKTLYFYNLRDFFGSFKKNFLTEWELQNVSQIGFYPHGQDFDIRSDFH